MTALKTGYKVRGVQTYEPEQLLRFVRQPAFQKKRVQKIYSVPQWQTAGYSYING